MKTDILQLALMIKETLGIDMTTNTESLQRKMTTRLQELELSVWEYIQYVKQHPTEWEHIINYVTINETYFFREEEQLNELIKSLHQLNKKHIRVWSAACSTGEEPYTLAMLLKEHLPADTVIDIVATDINQEVLEFAKKGVYSKNSLSFRRISAETRAQYFDERDQSYEVKHQYKELVKFSPFNLVSPDKWFLMKDFDIIFCRNVLIYFDEETVKDVIERFYYALGQEGQLFLGHSDPYRQIYHKFQFVRTPNTLYLKKGDTL